MNGYWKLGFIFICILFVFYGGWYMHGVFYDAHQASAEAAIIRSLKAKQDADAQKATIAESKLSKIQAQYDAIVGQYAKNPSPDGCKLPDKWVSQLNKFGISIPSR
jgi:hypothetical protein